jgi:hypothetical protein
LRDALLHDLVVISVVAVHTFPSKNRLQHELGGNARQRSCQQPAQEFFLHCVRGVIVIADARQADQLSNG